MRRLRTYRRRGDSCSLRRHGRHFRPRLERGRKNVRTADGPMVFLLLAGSEAIRPTVIFVSKCFSLRLFLVHLTLEHGAPGRIKGSVQTTRDGACRCTSANRSLRMPIYAGFQFDRTALRSVTRQGQSRFPRRLCRFKRRRRTNQASLRLNHFPCCFRGLGARQEAPALEPRK